MTDEGTGRSAGPSGLGVDVTRLFDAPLGSGLGQTALSVPDPWPVSIAGRRYMIDWRTYGRGVITPFREARDQNALPGETALNPASAWKRTRDDWSLGAGQTWADRALTPYHERITLEPRQYRDSDGIDPWTSGQFKCLPQTELIFASSSVKARLIHAGDWFWFNTSATAVFKSNNFNQSVPTDTAITGLAGALNDMTTDGTSVFFAMAGGIYICDTTATAATAMPGAAGGLGAAGFITWANGWLFTGNTNVLKEVRRAGTVNTVFTHPNTGFIWRCVTGSPNFIYAGGFANNDGSEIYRINVDNTGALTVPVCAATLPRGEALNTMKYYGGIVVLGTSRGVRVATQQGDGSLILGPLIVAIPAGVSALEADGQYVWFSWSNYKNAYAALGRLDLSQFSDALSAVPAYASDIKVASGQSVGSIVRYGDKTYFTTITEGVHRESFTGITEIGTMYMGRFRWGTFEPKVFLGAEIVTEPLTSAAISLSIADDQGNTNTLAERSFDSATGSGQILGVAQISEAHEWYEPIITIMPFGSGNAVVNRVTLRALPSPKVVENFTVPIVLYDNVNLEQGEGQEQPYDTAAEYGFLLGLVQSGAPVQYQEGRGTHLVTVRSVEWQEQSIVGMNHDRTSVQGVLVATLVSVEA